MTLLEITPQRGAGPWRVAALALAAVLVLALVGVVFLVLKLDQANDDLDQERADVTVPVAAENARDAAIDAAVHMTSYDFATLEQDFAWVKTDGTESFAETFEQASIPVKEAITRLKARAEGTVTRASVMLEDKRHATVMLFVDQAITDESSTEPKLDQSRVEMQLELHDGEWLVDQVELY